ncbi:trafficking protein particle complex subunit 9 isoform X2 [Lampetra fluviatilis]
MVRRGARAAGMSVPDYTQAAEEHQSLLVLVQPVGVLSEDAFQRVFDRVAALTQVGARDSSRAVCVRYRRHYPPDNNHWGDFQTHRKVVGLIGVAECASAQRWPHTFESFEQLRAVHAHSLFDSRLLVLGISGDAAEQPRSDVVFYRDADSCDGLEARVEEFVGSLFIVLESKRLDRASEKSGDKIPLLCVPFEKKDFVGLDTESRNYRKRCQGRMRKHVGDLSLQAGMLQDALVNYHIAVETLRSINDFLWLGAALEGLCAASVIYHYPNGTGPKPAPRKTSGALAPPDGDRKQRSGAQELLIDPGTLTSNGLSADPSTEIGRTKNCLSPDEIVERYREAISFYGKFKLASVVELEACIKVVRVLALQKKRIEASDFLQNAVYIHTGVSEEERIQRFAALADLYDLIGFRRKASFFKRVAAMQCVGPHVAEPGWKACYRLLLDTLPGYSLSLDPSHYNQGLHQGWPAVQLRVLHELVYASRRMGNPALGVRHMSFLLHTMLDFLSEQEKKEVSQVLETYTARCPGHTATIDVWEGLAIPAVPFTRLPIVRSLKPLNLPLTLRPERLKGREGHGTPVKSSPFIYSPIVSHTRRDPNDNPNKIDFQWVQGDVCEVQLKVYNPMPFELRVENVALLTSGVEFESLPAALSLPAESGLYPVTLVGVPKATGQITIQGYETTVFGVRSRCEVADLALGAAASPGDGVGAEEPATKGQSTAGAYEVVVVPALPLLQISTSLSRSASSLSPTAGEEAAAGSVCVRAYNGEPLSVTVRIRNIGKVAAETLELQLTPAQSRGDSVCDLLTWEPQEVLSQLPLAPGAVATLTLHLHSQLDFPSEGFLMELHDDTVTVTGTPFASPARQLMKPRLEMRTPGGTPPDHKHSGAGRLRTLEGTLAVRYTGGAGGVAGYYRRVTLGVRVEVEPSVVFARIGSLPATSSRRCHLLLDVLNTTDMEMLLSSRGNQDLVLHSHELKRVAVQVDKLQWEEPPDPRDSPVCILGPERPAQSPVECQEINQKLDIRWKLLSSGREGEASVETVLSTAVLEHLRLAPLQWVVEMCEQVCVGGEIVHCLVGEPAPFTVMLTNHSCCDVGLFTMSVEPCRDLHNGETETAGIAHEVAFVGSTSTLVGTVSPGGSYSFSCSPLFLFPGDYFLEIKLQESGGSTLPPAWLCPPRVHVSATVPCSLP